jgi:hypothetical protein
MPKKEVDEDKAFEQALKGKMGWKCSCALEVVDKNQYPTRCYLVKVVA